MIYLWFVAFSFSFSFSFLLDGRRIYVEGMEGSTGWGRKMEIFVVGGCEMKQTRQIQIEYEKKK